MLLLCYFWQKRTSINILLQLCFSAIATFISTYTYKIGNGNPIPPKSKKAIKRIFIEFTSYMYVSSSSRILLKATAENSCEGFRSSFTYPLLLSLSLFYAENLVQTFKAAQIMDTHDYGPIFQSKLFCVQ